MQVAHENKYLFWSEWALNPTLLSPGKMFQVEGQQSLKFWPLDNYCLNRKDPSATQW